MKVLVINLLRKPERLARMRKLLDDRGIDFERIEAVDGKDLSEDVIRAWSLKRPDSSLALSPSEVGCMLSHRMAWQAIADMPGGFGLVLEDDVHFSPAARHFLTRDDWIPAAAEIVKIETVNWKTAISRMSIPIGEDHRLARLHDQHFGMAGYILTPDSARRLLDEIGPVDMAIDQILFDPASDIFARFSIFQMVPALCIQDQFLDRNAVTLESDIVRAWKTGRKPKTLPQKAMREVRRLYGQIARAISGSRLNPFSRHVNVRVGFTEDSDRP